MNFLKSLGQRTFDFLLPGPTDGKNGDLRSLILGFEEQNRDRNLEPLFEILRRKSVHTSWSGLGTMGYEIVRHFRPRRIVELGTFRRVLSLCDGSRAPRARRRRDSPGR